jgi:carboxymethylenebutenolidase
MLTCSKIFGKKDNHVPPEGRDLIRKTLHDAGICFSFFEAAWAQRGFAHIPKRVSLLY